MSSNVINQFNKLQFKDYNFLFCYLQADLNNGDDDPAKVDNVEEMAANEYEKA